MAEGGQRMMNLPAAISVTKWGKPRKNIVHIVRNSIHDWRCSKCGHEGNSRDIHIHHGDGDHRNNTPPNLDLLCRKCHRIEHRINGPSKYPKVYPLVGDKAEQYKCKFNKRFAAIGGHGALFYMVKKNFTLEKIGKEFGVTRERARQWIVFLGIRRPRCQDDLDWRLKYETPPFKNRRSGRGNGCYKKALYHGHESWNEELCKFHMECYMRFVPERYLKRVVNLPYIDKRKVSKGEIPLTRKQAEEISAAMEQSISAEEILLACGEAN